MIQKNVVIPHHGRAVNGVLTLPESGGRSPAVLFCHGYNGNHADFGQDAAVFAREGIGSLAIDFCGGGTRDVSGFPTERMTMETEVEDLIAALDWLRALPEVEAVFLFGASMGGLASVLAAARVQERLAGVMLLFPALCIADDWNKRFADPSQIPETMEFWGMTLGKDYFLGLRKIDVFSLLPGLELPVILFHGDADDIVPLPYSQRAQALLPRSELHIFPGEGHGFSPAGAAETQRLALEFLKKQL